MTYAICRAPMIVVVVAVLMRGISSVSGAESTQLTDAGLVEAEQQRFSAQIAKDVSALQRALADELVYTHSSAKVQNKAEYLRAVETGVTSYRAIEVPDRVVHVWDNTGVTSGTITLRLEGDRKLVSRYTGVYIKRAGRWQLVAWQTTSLPEPK